MWEEGGIAAWRPRLLIGALANSTTRHIQTPSRGQPCETRRRAVARCAQFGEPDLVIARCGKVVCAALASDGKAQPPTSCIRHASALESNHSLRRACRVKVLDRLPQAQLVVNQSEVPRVRAQTKCPELFCMATQPHVGHRDLRRFHAAASRGGGGEPLTERRAPLDVRQKGGEPLLAPCVRSQKADVCCDAHVGHDDGASSTIRLSPRQQEDAVKAGGEVG